MKEKLLVKLLGALDNPSAVKGILLGLRTAEDIERKIEHLQHQKKQMVDRLEREIRGYDELISKVRSECDHAITSYHLDPSGGRDSHSTCDICGATL